MRKRAPILVLAAILAAFAWWYSHRPTHPPGTIEGSGTIEATQVDLAPQVAGRIVRITVIAGDAVKAGATLAVLDGVAQKDALRQAQANVAEAQDRVKQAQANLVLETRQYAANLAQAEANTQSNVPKVPQAAESTRLQEGTVEAQIHLVEAQVNSARASLAAATGNARAAEDTWRAAQGNLQTAQANLDKAASDNTRYEALYGQDAVSAQQRDAALEAWRAARGQQDAARDQVGAAQAQRDAARQQEAAAQAALAQADAALQQAQVNRRTVAIRRLDVAQSQGQLKQAQAGVRVAEAGKSLIDERRHELQAAQAALADSRASLSLAQTNLDDTVLKAPFDCTVLTKDVEVGDLVSVGSPVVTIADLKHPYLRLFIGETEVGRVKLGQAADVEVDSFPGRTFQGVVDEIRSTAEYTPTNVQTKDERAKLVFGVRLALNNPDGYLKPGLPADALILAP